MSGTVIKDAMVWVDVETTGLKPTSTVLEVGLVVTDLDMEVLTSCEFVIQPADPNWEDEMDDYVHQMHSKHGLIHEIRNGQGTSLQTAEEKLVDFYLRYVGAKTPMCGSTVSQDRVWLRESMPRLEALFSHRHIDNSTIKELCRRYNPEVYKKVDGLPRKEYHRVYADLIDSLTEAKFYRDNFFFDARPF